MTLDRSNTGDGGCLQLAIVSPAVEFDALEALPPRLRALLNHAPVKFSAAQAAAFLKQGYSPAQVEDAFLLNIAQRCPGWRGDVVVKINERRARARRHRKERQLWRSACAVY